MGTKVGSLHLAPSRALSYAVTSPSGEAGQHPIVLLSSPLCATLAIWDPVVPQLTALGFEVVRYDIPGHGQSGAPTDLASTTFDSLAQDVHDLLAHLGIRKLHAWIGVSLGAATSIVFTAKYTDVAVERLVPCCTVSCSPVNAGTADIFSPRIAAAREAGNMDAAVDGTMDRWFGRAWLDSHPDEAGRVRKLMRDTTIDGFETCCAALRSASFDLRPLAATAGSHVGSALLLVGEKDDDVSESMEGLRQGIESGLKEGKSKRGETVPSVRLEVVRGGGHACFVDGFESFLGFVTEFLK
ncbi:zearalenone lactonase [Xylaria sp. FL1042]|nr:zearalenone lactonase [Xylaria sp. FL1042]